MRDVSQSVLRKREVVEESGDGAGLEVEPAEAAGALTFDVLGLSVLIVQECLCPKQSPILAWIQSQKTDRKKEGRVFRPGPVT
jgi:hypothetical protein